MGETQNENTGDLISRNYLLSQYGLKDAMKYGNETAEQQRNSYDTLMKYEIADMIEDAPIAFDLESVIARLEDQALEHAINGQQFGEDGYTIHEAEEQGIKKGIEIAIENLKCAVVYLETGGKII